MFPRPARIPAIALWLAATLLVTVVGSLLAPPPVLALEKALVRLHTPRPDDWESMRTSVTVSYFNICTGWIWAWSGFADRDRIAMQFESCPTVYGHSGILEHSWILFYEGAIPDYGYTAQVEVYARGPDGCPTGTARGRTNLLPQPGWNMVDWGSVYLPTEAILVATFLDPQGFGHPAALASEASVNPTGPPGCGTCYPSTRETRSGFVPGWTNSYCPPEPLADELCEVEWLAVHSFICPIHTVSTEDGSWGSIKSLYR